MIIMKIRKVLDKKVGNTAYYKYLITLPKNVVDESKLTNRKLRALSGKERIIITKE